MTGTELLRRVRNTLGDNGSIMVEDTDGMDAINDALIEVARALEAPTAVFQASSVVGQLEYVLPTDFIKPISATYDGETLDYIPRADIEDWDSFAFDPSNTYTGIPTIYYVDSENLALYPAPSSVVTDGIKMKYVKVPTFITAVADEVPYRKHVHPYIARIVTAIFKEKDEDYEAAAQIRGDALVKLIEIKTEANNPDATSYASIREVR